MMIAWAAYAVAAGLALAVAGVVAEPLAMRHRRAVWAVAIFVSVCIPVVLPFVARPGAPAPAASGLTAAPSLPGLAAGSPIEPRPSAFSGKDGLFAIAWALASLTLLATLVATHHRASCDARGWKAGEVAREPALLSDDFGPAVVGFFPARVVLPRWTLALSADEQRLIVRHEREHVLAHDQHLLLLALGMLVLMPWNVALWIQLARLRGAIELDCDARVARGVNAARYASVLVAASERQVARPAAALALLHPVSSLMRRIEALTARRRISAARMIAGAATSLSCVMLASLVPAPAGVAMAMRQMMSRPAPLTAKGTQPAGVSVTAQAVSAPSPSAPVRRPVSRAPRNRASPARPLTLATGQLGLTRTPPSATEALRELQPPAAPPGLPSGGRVSGGRGGAGGRATLRAVPGGASAGAFANQLSPAGRVVAIPAAADSTSGTARLIRRTTPDSARDNAVPAGTVRATAIGRPEQ